MKLIRLSQDGGETLCMNPVPGIVFGALVNPSSRTAKCNSWIQNGPAAGRWYVRETPAVIAKKLAKV